MYPIAFITALGFGALGTIGSILFYIDSWKSLHLIEGISHKFFWVEWPCRHGQAPVTSVQAVFPHTAVP